MLAVYVVDDYRHTRYPPGILAPREPYQRLIASGSPWSESGQQFTPLADFHLRARVLHTEPYWFDHGSLVSPLDLAIGWGPMSDQAVLDEISINQGQRWYRFWPRHQKFPIATDDIVSHSANVHVVPSTPEVKKQLRSLREGDIVEMDGYLVEIAAPDGGKWRSSLSRTDIGQGASELMWVKTVTKDVRR